MLSLTHYFSLIGFRKFASQNRGAKASDIHALFDKPQIGFEVVLRPTEERKQKEIKDCYTNSEILKN